MFDMMPNTRKTISARNTYILFELRRCEFPDVCFIGPKYRTHAERLRGVGGGRAVACRKRNNRIDSR